MRIRMVNQPDYASSLLGGFVRLNKEEGLLSTLAGLAAMLCKQVPYTTGKQVSFDVLTTFFYGIPAMVKVSACGQGRGPPSFPPFHPPPPCTTSFET